MDNTDRAFRDLEIAIKKFVESKPQGALPVYREPPIIEDDK